jgi:hypothetical protein
MDKVTVSADALNAYRWAELTGQAGDYKAACRLLFKALEADLLKAAPRYVPMVESAPKARKTAPKAMKKNVSRGLKSKAFGGVSLPVVQLQNCGHTFNSSGSPACIKCLSAKWASGRGIVVHEGPHVPDIIARRDAMLAAANGGIVNYYCEEAGA